jgi:hypothetical protein
MRKTSEAAFFQVFAVSRLRSSVLAGLRVLHGTATRVNFIGDFAFSTQPPSSDKWLLKPTKETPGYAAAAVR